MIDLLHALERDLPTLLERDAWTCVLIDKHPPTMRRAWIQLDNCRLYLHESMPHEGDAYWHAHPWPCAVKVFSGDYETAFAATDLVCTLASARVRASRGFCYEMIDPKARHYVRVLGKQPALSMMVTTRPYARSEWKPHAERPKLLSHAERMGLFGAFKAMVRA